MLLQHADGWPFATGSCPYLDHLAPRRSTKPRIFIPIAIGASSTQAAVDTGGVYFICDPELLGLLGLPSSPSLGRETVRIRGVDYKGHLHRLSIALQAVDGKGLQLKVTAFVPHLDPDQEWMLPNFLGLQGCLEFLRFAVDPAENMFYFGPV